MARPRVLRWLEIALVWFLLTAGLAVRYHTTQSWRFAGSDTYGYLKVAEELRLHHRYALGPEPEPLAWVRPPLFSLFILVAKGDLRADIHGGEGWIRLKLVQIWLEVLGTGLLTYFLARRFAGVLGGGLALALVMFWPPTVLGAGSILTECLGTLLYTAAIAPLVLGEARPRRWFAVAGAMVALSTLLRPDGLLLAAAFVPAVLWLRGERPWRRRIVVGLVAALAFTFVFAPWPIRNYLRFQELRPVGGRIDRYQRPVLHYEGFWEWLRSWAPDWQPMTWPTTCYYDLGCRPWIELYDGPGAFDSPAERSAVNQLLLRRIREGHSPAVSAGFLQLAEAKRRRHPIAYHLTLPLSRAYHMWVAPFDELLQGVPPWPAATAIVRRYMEPASGVLFFSALAGSVILLGSRRTRRGATVLVVAVGVRTAVMAYTFYCMPRYAVEQLPIVFVLVAAGAVEGGRLLHHRLRRRQR